MKAQFAKTSRAYFKMQLYCRNYMLQCSQERESSQQGTQKADLTARKYMKVVG